MDRVPLDSCPDSCSNRGKCYRPRPMPKCICPMGFEGERCEFVVVPEVTIAPATPPSLEHSSGCYCILPWIVVVVLVGVCGFLFRLFHVEWLRNRDLPREDKKAKKDKKKTAVSQAAPTAPSQ